MKHRVTKARPLGLAIAGALLLATAAVHADQAQDLAAIQNFRLTDEFLAKYLAVLDDAAKDPCNQLGLLSILRDGKKQPLDQMVAAYDAQPGVHAMLARHGLTAREEILGALTLLAASMQKEHPDLVQSSGAVSPVNLAFYKAHETALAASRQHRMELARQRLKANHGKLPACINQ
jgi:hypothetical protein